MILKPYWLFRYREDVRVLWNVLEMINFFVFFEYRSSIADKFGSGKVVGIDLFSTLTNAYNSITIERLLLEFLHLRQEIVFFAEMAVVLLFDLGKF